MRNYAKKRGPSITRGLVTTVNTIREKRHARATGKQRRATILRTLQNLTIVPEEIANEKLGGATVRHQKVFYRGSLQLCNGAGHSEI